MNIAPTKEQILDEIILGLADHFESGKLNWYSIEQDRAHPEEFEPLRECLAEMISERWLAHFPGVPLYRLTPEGYKHFKPRIQALRALGKD